MARPPFAGRQAHEGLGVAEDREGLPERAHEVLALREIDAGLPADRSIDLAEQRGRDVDDRSATVIARRREAGHVGHDASTDGHDDVAAVHVTTSHGPADLLDCRKRLGPLSVWDRHDLERHARVDLDTDAGLGHDGRAAGAAEVRS